MVHFDANYPLYLQTPKSKMKNTGTNNHLFSINQIKSLNNGIYIYSSVSYLVAKLDDKYLRDAQCAMSRADLAHTRAMKSLTWFWFMDLAWVNHDVITQTSGSVVWREIFPQNKK